MTDPTRGARIRRGARRPGWILTTALLVLAIAASSALVFTNRVELLKLAVILALWAAVVAAFVSVIYRRQSDTDQAKVRDLKLVYDLQLEREISARREYELSVESHLRRELAAELRAQSADEVAALRAELAALRANLEYLFDADLSHRPAIETDRAAPPSLTEWGPRPEGAGRVRSSRIDAEETAILHEIDDHSPDTEESPIIDVPAEPHPPEENWPPAAEPAGGAHRRAGEREPAPGPWAPPPPPPPPETPPPPPQFPWLPPQASPPPPPPPPPEPAPEPEPVSQWEPAPAEGRFIPAGEPGSNWVAPPVNGTGPEYVGRRRAPESEPEPEPPRGRHSSSAAETPEPEPVPEETDDDGDGGAHTGGQSVAELLARLQATPSGGGRRRRRED
ncbi:MAG: hypothetical protein HZB45_14165 [Mycolicibacterium rufum]|uniref:DUF6779 domain-containing protein n=1 Tax=Mycolicibacterium chlorophenolicum TaxID=37916 RepID=A0A0J6WLR9_9MYCO|nr:DUF6779 domain-containing protein [Mycolicibacterium chlorophenolicum]KMO83529.1 hypothetical protein MCHLDSM_00456 [Mycolicibacterium chlorophenolicum]MBI5338823.1 hypothetical protein [Mycolicibacterium rufum]